MEIIKINEESWRIEDNGVRFFLIMGSNKALLIDSGMTVHNAREIASGLTDLPIEMLYTHADPDHIGSNPEFHSFFMHPAEEPNYRKNGGLGEITEILEGDILELGNRTMEVIELPGHSPGSIALLDEKYKVLISGDPIQYGTIFMFGTHRNMQEYIRSLKHLDLFKNRIREIWPSHAEFPIGVEAIDYVRECAEKIVSGNASGQPTDFHGQPILRFDFEKTAFLCDDKR